MEDISVRGNCGFEELKNCFCLPFVYNLIISSVCPTNKCE